MSDTYCAIEAFDGKNNEEYLFEPGSLMTLPDYEEVSVRLLDHPANGVRRGALASFPVHTVTARLLGVGDEYVKAMLPKEEGANTERTKDEVRQRYVSAVDRIGMGGEYRLGYLQALEWAFPWLLADDAE